MFNSLSSGGDGDAIWLLEGNVDSVDETEVIGDGCSSNYWSLIHFHGLFMFIGWGLLLVVGVFFAKFFRSKDPLWFRVHVGCQVKNDYSMKTLFFYACIGAGKERGNEFHR